MRLGFIGLGVMGYSMAGHLRRLGYNINVYNRSLSKAEQWVNDFGGKFYETPSALSLNSDVIFICVGNDEDVLSIVEGDRGILSSLSSGNYVVDHTTTSARLSKYLSSEFSQKGIDFLDAPVSGGEIGAKKGLLSTMVGGEEKVFKKLEKYLRGYSKIVTYMGAAGSGQLAKMVNQICIAGVLEGLSEGLSLAIREGLDISSLLQAIGGGAAQSWQLDNRARSMVEDKFDFGFAIDWMVKDLSYSLEQAQVRGLELDNAKLVLERYKKLKQQGYGKSDTSVLIKDINRDKNL